MYKSLAEALDEMSIKDFRAFEVELAEIGQQKVNKHFQRLFSSYTLSDVLKTVLDKYLQYCEFNDGTILSRSLTCEDNLYSYDISYDKITFGKHDTFMEEEWVLKGTPEDYKAELPYEYRLTFMSNQSREKVPLPEEWILVVLALWTCYRIYVDSNPDDDRSLDEEEQEEQKAWDESMERFREPKDYENDEKYIKIREDSRIQREKEEASRAIEKQIRDEKHQFELKAITDRREAIVDVYKDSVEKMVTRIEDSKKIIGNRIDTMKARILELESENRKLKSSVEIKDLYLEHKEGKITSEEYDTRVEEYKTKVISNIADIKTEYDSHFNSSDLEIFKKQMADLIMNKAIGQISDDEYHAKIVEIKRQLEEKLATKSE